MRKDELTLRIHPADQVEAATRPGDLGYRLRPASKKGVVGPTKPYGILLGFASNPEVALIGELNLRGVVKLYRLVVHRGQLLLHELIRPDELAATDDIDLADVSEAEVERARSLAAGMVEDFDPAAYRNLTVERIAELVASKAGDATPTPTEAKAPVAEVADILSLLERSIEDRKGAAPREEAA
jgi:non-homologous end joining protein Ku